MNNELFMLKGKTALVTGASSGLGAHFAHVTAEAGAQVVLCARRIDKLDKIVASIKANGGEATAIAMDVTRQDSIESALKQTESIYGTVQVLINNAGAASSGWFAKTTEKNWDMVMETNLKGAWRVAQAVTQHLLENDLGGSIVNISSILGLRVGLGESIYAISKAGVVQMTKAMALELASKDIRVNALCPGYFRTEMNMDYLSSEAGTTFIKSTPAKRTGNLNELTAPLLLLCSDAGSFINGITLPVDGGHLVQSL